MRKTRYAGDLGAMALGVFLVATVATNAQAEELTVVGWGGALSAAEAEAFDKPFTAETGVKILAEVYNGGLAQVKAQIESGKVTWDVLDAEMTDAELGCVEGLLEEIPTADLAPGADGSSPEKDFFDDALHDCGVANYVWANVYAYDKQAFPNGGPQKIADLFDVEGFPGKRGLRKSPKANLEWALMADGVPLNEVYDVLAMPEGVERAFAVLDRVKDNTVWWEAGAQPPQLLADGEVAMTSAYNGRLFNAIVKEKQPFEIVWDGQVWDYGAFIVPGLVMLSLLTQSVSNAAFGIYFPRFTGTIYEVLSAPITYYEILLGYVGAAATKSIILGLIILATASLIVPLQVAHPFWMMLFLIVISPPLGRSIARLSRPSREPISLSSMVVLRARLLIS